MAAADSMKKSQIQQIKEGLAMRQKTYSGRLQPLGPKSPLPTRNAVNLSTVPATSSEKFNGGEDEECATRPSATSRPSGIPRAVPSESPSSYRPGGAQTDDTRLEA